MKKNIIKHKKLFFIFFVITLSLIGIVTSVFALTQEKERETQFTFTFYDMNASATYDEVEFTFSSKTNNGNNISNPIKIVNESSTNGVRYEFTIDWADIEESKKAWVGNSISIYYDGEFVGTLESVTKNQTVIFSGYLPYDEKVSVSTTKEVSYVYHNASQASCTASITLTTTFYTLDPNEYTFVNNADDMEYYLYGIENGEIANRTFILNSDITLNENLSITIPENVNITFDTYAHNLDCNGLTLNFKKSTADSSSETNSNDSIINFLSSEKGTTSSSSDSSSSEESTLQETTDTSYNKISNLRLGTNSFINFEDSVTLDLESVDISGTINQDIAYTYIENYLNAHQYDRVVNYSSYQPLGNLSLYQKALSITITTQSVTTSDNQEQTKKYIIEWPVTKPSTDSSSTSDTTSYKRFEVNVYITTDSVSKELDIIMESQKASTENLDSDWTSVGRVSSDLYLPKTLGTNNSKIIWYSSSPEVITTSGKYYAPYKAQTVKLTAAIFENGTTTFQSYYVRVQGYTYQQRLDYIAAYYGIETIDDSNKYYEIISTQYNDGKFSSIDFEEMFNVKGFIVETVKDKDDEKPSIPTVNFEYGEIYSMNDGLEAYTYYQAQINRTSNDHVNFSIVAYFDDGDGIIDNAYASTIITQTIDVAATNPGTVIEEIKNYASSIDIYTNILNDLYHDELHSTYNEGSFTLPNTYPIGSKVNASEDEIEAEYMIVYALNTDSSIKNINNSAVILDGTTNKRQGSYKSGEDSDLSTNHIFNIQPQNFLTSSSVINVSFTIYATNGEIYAVDNNYYGYLTFDVPAALTASNKDEGFVSNLINANTSVNIVDPAFGIIRDLVLENSTIEKVECKNHPYVDRSFIFVNDIFSSYNSITEIDLSLDAINEYLYKYSLSLDTRGYKLDSINGLSYFTKLEILNLNDSAIGDTSNKKKDDEKIDNSKKTMNLIAAKENLKELYLNNCNISNISSFSVLSNLEIVELADNKSLRNISSLIYSSNTLKKLDICNTLAIEDVYDKEFTLTDGKYTYDSYIYYGSYIYYYYHSILEEMYSAYQKANPSSEMPYYYLYIFSDGSHSNDQKHDFTTIEENITSSDSTTSTETITKVKPSCYIPYTYDDNNSTDVMTQVCKEYAYRFDNIIEMTDVILLQYKFIAANGEPSASISYSIENITDAEGNKITTGGSDGPTFKTDDGKEIGYFYVFTNSKPANFEDYAIYLDLTTNNYRLYRGYSFTNNKYSFTNYAVNWVICLKMTITVAGKSFSRYFYITVLPETDTTTNTVGSSTDTTNNTTN